MVVAGAPVQAQVTGAWQSDMNEQDTGDAPPTSPASTPIVEASAEPGEGEGDEEGGSSVGAVVGAVRCMVETAHDRPEGMLCEGMSP